MKRLLGVPLILLAGCAFGPRWTHHMNTDLVKVAVIPPFSGPSEAGQEDMVQVLAYVEEELRYRGYDVLPRETVVAFYQKNRFNIHDEIKMYSAEQLAKEFGVQGLVYTQAEFWGKRVMGVANYVGVELSFQLVDAKGQETWKNTGKAGQESGGTDKRSILGALIGTALTSPSSFADEAVVNGFATLGHSGYDAEHLKAMEAPPAATPAPQ